MAKLEEAITALFSDETPASTRAEIDEWMQHWTKEPASVPVACHILNPTAPSNPKLVFFAAKAIDTVLQQNMHMFTPDSLAEITTIARSRILLRRNSLTDFDVSGLMILYVHCSFLLAPVYEEAFAAFDSPDLLFEFLKIYFQELWGNFATKCLNHQFGNTRKDQYVQEKIPQIFELLTQTALSLRWYQVFYEIFRWRENPGQFLPLVPRLAEGLNDPSTLPVVFKICECALNYDGMEESAGFTNEFLEKAMMMLVEISDKDASYKSVAWDCIFKYSHAFTFERRDMAHAMVQKFLNDVPIIMTETNLGICQSFSDFITVPQSDPDFASYRFDFLTIIAELVNRGILTGETEDIITVSDAVRRILEKNVDISLQFLSEMPKSSGCVFIAKEGRVDEERVYMPILEFVVTSDATEPTFTVQFLKRVLSQDYSVNFGPQILQKAFQMQGIVPFLPAELAKTVALLQKEVVLANFVPIKERVIPQLPSMHFRDQVCYVLMLWIVISHLPDGQGQEDLVLIAQQILTTCRNVVESEDQHKLVQYLESLEKLIAGCKAQCGQSEVMTGYYQTLMNSIFEILAPIMTVDNDAIQEGLGVVVAQALAANWIANPDTVWTWIQAIFQGNLVRPNHFNVILSLGGTPPEFVVAAMLYLNPDDNEEIIAKVFTVLRGILEKDANFFWAAIPLEFILQFGGASRPKIVLEVIEFGLWIMMKKISCPNEFMITLLRGLLGRLGTLDQSTQGRVVNLLKKGIESQIFDRAQVEAMIAELYPKISPNTEKLTELLRADPLGSVWLIHMKRELQQHVAFNR